ncbi:MAG: hypothetical protein ACN6N0_10520, partial [Microvirgula sp.]
DTLESQAAQYWQGVSRPDARQSRKRESRLNGGFFNGTVPDQCPVDVPLGFGGRKVVCGATTATLTFLGFLASLLPCF